MLNPLLPVALIAGQSVAARRLMKHGVFCVDPKRIAVCGKIRLAAFDKTGTLTQNDMICKQGDVACSVLLVISGSQSALTPSSPRPRLLQPLRYCIICLGECAAIELD